MKLKKSGLAASAVLAMVTLAACSGSGQSDAPEEGFADEIVIGVPLDTSGAIGPVVEIGLSEREGIRVAAEEINESGFLGDTKIVLKETDTATNRDDAVKAVTQYVDRGVDAIVGFTLTPSFGAAVPLALRAQIPVVAVGLGGSGVEDSGDLVFRSYPNVATVYPAADIIFAEDVDADRAGLIYASDSEASVSIHEARSKALDEAGVDVVKEVAVGSQDTDLRAALVQLKDENPDVVVASVTPGQVSALAIQAEEVGLDAQLVLVDGTQTPATLEAAGTELQCSVFQALWSHDSDAPNNAHFLEEFAKRSDRQPDTFAAASYDALWVLVTALKDADTAKADKVADALLAIDDYQGVLGTYDYTDGTGAPKLAGHSLMIDGGEAVPYEPGACTR